MKTKIIQFVPALFTFLIIGFSYFSQWCTSYGHVCFRTVLDRMIPEMTYPSYFFALFFLPIAIILIFVSRSTFNSWLKFAAWTVPLSILYIATTPVNFTGIGMDFFPFYRDDAARLAGEVFAAGSFVLIIWKFIKFRFISFASKSENRVSDIAHPDIFSFKPFVSYIFAPCTALVLLILFALQYPFRGGLIPDSLAIFFGLAVAGSTYALAQGFLLLRRRGLKGWHTFAWYTGVLVAILLSVNILVFGFELFNSTIKFPGSHLLISPVITSILIVLQTFYFLAEMISAFLSARTTHHARDWYATTYLLILGFNTALIFVGPLVTEHLIS